MNSIKYYLGNTPVAGWLFRVALSVLVFQAMSGLAIAQMPFGAAPGPTEVSLGKGVPTTGRFQVFVSPNIEGKTFMIDSDTGRIWLVKKNHATGDLFLEMLKVQGIYEKEKDDGEAEPIDSKQAPK
jgi:hypothetical protein